MRQPNERSWDASRATARKRIRGRSPASSSRYPHLQPRPAAVAVAAGAAAVRGAAGGAPPAAGGAPPAAGAAPAAGGGGGVVRWRRRGGGRRTTGGRRRTAGGAVAHQPAGDARSGTRRARWWWRRSWRRTGGSPASASASAELQADRHQHDAVGERARRGHRGGHEQRLQGRLRPLDVGRRLPVAGFFNASGDDPARVFSPDPQRAFPASLSTTPRSARRLAMRIRTQGRTAIRDHSRRLPR